MNNNSYIIGGVIATSLIVTALAVSSKEPDIVPDIKCAEFAEKCVVNSDCCTSYSCKTGLCLNNNVKPNIDAFLLCTLSTTVKKSNNLFNKNPLETLTSNTKEFWKWSNGSLSYSIFNELGEVTTFYISNGDSSGYATSSTQKTTVIIADNNTIYNSSYTRCLDFDDQGFLVWRTFTNTTKPSSFVIVTNEGDCPSTCLTNNDCCAPYGNCLNKQCVTCKGDPEEIKLTKCPELDTYMVCGENNEWSCKSRCTNTVQCGETEESKCSINVDNTWTNKCVDSCDASKKQSCTGYIKNPLCNLIDNTPVWECPSHPCDNPAPDFNLAPIPEGYTVSMIGDQLSYSNINNPGKYSLFPVWKCATQTWEYTKGCNIKYKRTCGANTYGVCGVETDYDWKCLTSTQTNLCGLSVNDCGPDATCIDVNSCDGNSEKEINTWKWICPSGISTLCETVQYNQLNVKTVKYDNTSINVYFKGENPVYPTIDNKKCRSTTASYIGNPYMQSIINNKKGNIVGKGTISDPYNIPIITNTSQLDGTEKYIVSKFGSDNGVYNWDCLSENPCKNGGKYVKSDNSTYDPNYKYPNTSGVDEPPTSGELFTTGKCLCSYGYVGIDCNVTRANCNNHGTPSNCNYEGNGCIDNLYKCACDPGFIGPLCYPDCNGNGEYNPTTGKCECTDLSTAIFPYQTSFNLFKRTGDNCELYEDKNAVETFITNNEVLLANSIVKRLTTCNYGLSDDGDIYVKKYNLDIDMYNDDCTVSTKYLGNTQFPSNSIPYNEEWISITVPLPIKASVVLFKEVINGITLYGFFRISSTYADLSINNIYILPKNTVNKYDVEIIQSTNRLLTARYEIRLVDSQVFIMDYYFKKFVYISIDNSETSDMYFFKFLLQNEQIQLGNRD